MIKKLTSLADKFGIAGKNRKPGLKEKLAKVETKVEATEKKSKKK